MNNLYKFFGIIIVTLFIYSCDHTEDVNYTPKTYSDAPSLDLTISNDLALDGVTVLESSFRINLTPALDGVAYYAVFAAGSAAPDAEVLIRKTASALQKDDVSLTGQAASIEIVSSGINPGYSYDIYVVMTSVDGVAGSVQKASFTTPDDTDPVFLVNSSSPFHEENDISPFLTSVTFNFSEQVFYQGNDITFAGFFDGVVVVLTAAGFDSSTNGTNNLTFTTSEMWGVNDFMIGSFDSGTFTDNVGHEVAALGGFTYYFLTRTLTLIENIELNSTGLYDYVINNGLFVGVPVAPDGQYNVINDGDEITVLNGVAQGVGVTTNEHVLRFENNDDGDGIGFLFNVNDPQPSIYTFGGTRLYWHSYFNFLFTGVAGVYDFNTGEFFYRMDFADELGFNGPIYLGDLEYIFTPNTSGRSSSRQQGDGIMNHPKVKKLLHDMDVVRGSMENNINPLLYDDAELSINN